MSREPTAVITTLGAFLASVVKVAQLLGFIELDGDQMAGVTLVIDNFLLLAGALFIRNQVTPTSDPVLDVGTSVNHGHAVVSEVNEIDPEGASSE